jgi:hypothetical protein
MTIGILKPLGTERSCNTQSNTYGGNPLVRITHTGAVTSSHLITCKYANATVRYTFSLTGSTSAIVEKGPTDTLESTDTGTTIGAVAIAYKA